MFFCILNDGQPSQWPLTFDELKKAFPSVSFCLPIDEQALLELEVAVIHSSTKPSFNPATHKLQEAAPILEEGRWQQQWQTVALTSEEQAVVDQNQADMIRASRNARLSQCDWTQLPDSPADATAWATYRQALRDLPSTDGWPHNITWPTEPS